MRPSPTRRDYEEQLAQELLPKVRPLATRHAGKLDADELESIGILALALAIRRYDPAVGAQPWTYCLPCVRGAMLEAIGRVRGWHDIPLEGIWHSLVDRDGDPQDNLPDDDSELVTADALSAISRSERVLLYAFAAGVEDDGEYDPELVTDADDARELAAQVDAILDCRPPGGVGGIVVREGCRRRRIRHMASRLHEAMMLLGRRPRRLRSMRQLAWALRKALAGQVNGMGGGGYAVLGAGAV